jgi:hypothetical protein
MHGDPDAKRGVTAKVYCAVLDKHLFPILNANSAFNTRIHVAKASKKWL